MAEGYIEVIVDIATKALDKPFTYKVPKSLESKISIGSLVTMPFGRGNQLRQGYVINKLDHKPDLPYTLKEIDSVSDELTVENELIDLAYFMSKRYVANLQLSLNAMIPSKQDIKRIKKTIIYKNVSDSYLQVLLDGLKDEPRNRKRRAIYKALLDNDSVDYDRLKEEFGCDRSMLKRMADKEIIRLDEQLLYRNPFHIDAAPDIKKEPSIEQKYAINTINESIDKEQSDVFLLHGKTGTGKTEVFMQVISHSISQGKNCIVLIPEIGLTPQTVRRFTKRFGNQVGLMHSKLSAGEKYDQWLKAKEGKINIMIGPRSAIFAPFSNIGAIIIDESHETSYKSETNPKYHAREIGIKRGDFHHCPVILATATPLVENYYKAMTGKYKLLKLNQRFSAYEGPKVKVVDMREELLQGNGDIFSNDLREAIKERIAKKEQIILFINRRGHSNFISCRKCGHVVKCESCDMPYTYHSSVSRLICHHCGKSLPMISKCPVCDSTYIKTFGVGTQKVENRLKALFQDIKVLRMDFDTTALKGGHEKIINAFSKGDYDVLIGTQMVAKGHHFERVSLVGVLAADMSLYMDDFRAAEKTFQLLNQVNGRAGRGQIAGESIIQTYSPDHMSIIYAKNDDYEGFYNEEIQLRELLDNPPFTTLLKVIIQGTDEKRVIEVSQALANTVLPHALKMQIRLLGPAPAAVSKIKKKYRWQLIMKGKNYKQVQQLAFYINDIKMKYLSDKLMTIGLEINPMSI